MKKKIFTTLTFFAVAIALAVAVQARELTNRDTTTTYSHTETTVLGSTTYRVNGTTINRASLLSSSGPQSHKVEDNRAEITMSGASNTYLLRFAVSSAGRLANVGKVELVFDCTLDIPKDALEHINDEDWKWLESAKKWQYTHTLTHHSYTTGSSTAETPYWYVSAPKHLKLVGGKLLDTGGYENLGAPGSFTVLGVGTANGLCPGFNKPHKFTITVATCTTPEITHYKGWTCDDANCASRVEYDYTRETAPALGHAYESVVTPPTCTEDGYTTHTCSRCGDKYVDSEVPAKKPCGDCEDCKSETPCESCQWDNRSSIQVPHSGNNQSSANGSARQSTLTCTKCGFGYIATAEARGTGGSMRVHIRIVDAQSKNVIVNWQAFPGGNNANLRYTHDGVTYVMSVTVSGNAVNSFSLNSVQVQ